jgi:hypothetical protein
LDDLIIAIQADFVKYKKQIPPTNIKSVFESVVMQVGTKFNYSNDLTSLASSDQASGGSLGNGRFGLSGHPFIEQRHSNWGRD